MYIKEFKSDPSQLLIAVLRLLFFTAIPLASIYLIILFQNPNALFIGLASAAALICIDTVIILFFFKITVRITETEVQFLRRGKVYESRFLKYYDFASSTFTHSYNFIPVLTIRKLTTKAVNGPEHNICCHCFSKNTFDLFMTSILLIAAKSKVDAVDAVVAEEREPEVIKTPVMKHYLFPKNAFIAREMASEFIADLIIFILCTGAAIWMFIALKDDPVRFFPCSFILCVAVAPIIRSIFLRSWLDRHVPSTILFDDTALYMDDRFYLLSDITGIKATPVNYQSRTHAKARKITIFEGRKKTVYLLGNISLGVKPEPLFPEYNDLVGTLKEFQNRSGQELIFDS